MSSLNFTLSDLRGQLLEVTNWLSSLGISASKGRIAHYWKVLEPHTQGKGSFNQDFLNAIFELDELRRLARIPLAVLSGNRTMASIRKLAKGHAFYHQEKDGKARSFAFELSVAARIAASWPDVRLEDPADVCVKIAGSDLWVECKRPNSAESAARCLGEAVSWFARKSDANADPPVRVVAIDLTRALNGSFVYGQAESASRRQELVDSVLALSNRFVATSLLPTARETTGYSSISAFAFRVRVVVDTANPARLDVFDEWTLFPGNPDEQSLRIIADAFGASR